MASPSRSSQKPSLSRSHPDDGTPRYAKRSRTETSRREDSAPSAFSNKVSNVSSSLSTSLSSQSPFKPVAGPAPRSTSGQPNPPSKSLPYLSSFQSSSSQALNCQVDHTDSPSLPSSSVSGKNLQSPLPADLPLKTPVCIGQLTVTALYLYPIDYISLQNKWANVRLQYEHNPNKGSCKDTIHIRVPSQTGPNGDNVDGKLFGAVEQKVADILGPLLGKGLIRLSAQIWIGVGNMKLPILPLQMLVYTPKGNITVIGNYFRESNLVLERPLLHDMQRMTTSHYFKPHHVQAQGLRKSTT